MGFWLEVVTLVVPGFNDSDAELRQIAEFLSDISPDIPWHVTAFRKDYKMQGPEDTPAETLLRAAATGRAAGLRYVYAGNLPGLAGLEDTRCPGCGDTPIERRGFRVLCNRLSAGKCPRCGCAIPGVWDRP
jgi:pyruvate formate lyase activating enzyme